MSEDNKRLVRRALEEIYSRGGFRRSGEIERPRRLPRVNQLVGMVFDLDDTLTDHRGPKAEVWQQIAELVGARIDGVRPPRSCGSDTSRTSSRCMRLLAGELRMDAFQRAPLTDAVAPWRVPDAELMDGYLALKQRPADETRPAPGAAAALQAVRVAGLRIGVPTTGLTDLQQAAPYRPRGVTQASAAARLGLSTSGMNSVCSAPRAAQAVAGRVL